MGDRSVSCERMARWRTGSTGWDGWLEGIPPRDVATRREEDVDELPSLAELEDARDAERLLLLSDRDFDEDESESLESESKRTDAESDAEPLAEPESEAEDLEAESDPEFEELEDEVEDDDDEDDADDTLLAGDADRETSFSVALGISGSSMMVALLAECFSIGDKDLLETVARAFFRLDITSSSISESDPLSDLDDLSESTRSLHSSAEDSSSESFDESSLPLDVDVVDVGRDCKSPPASCSEDSDCDVTDDTTGFSMTFRFNLVLRSFSAIFPFRRVTGLFLLTFGEIDLFPRRGGSGVLALAMGFSAKGAGFLGEAGLSVD